MSPDGYKLHHIPATEHRVVNDYIGKVSVQCDSGNWREVVRVFGTRFPDQQLSVPVSIHGIVWHLTGTAEELLSEANRLEQLFPDFGFRGLS